MSDLPPFDPYDVLGVEKDADAATIKKSYRKLALIKHPDKCSDDALKQARTDEFQRLNEAYAIIGDEEKRKRHDALIKLEALRKEKFAMGGPPRPFARSATFANGYPTGTAYTSRGTTNVEDRVPKGFYEDDDRYRRRASNDYDYPRRSAGGTARAERARDEERRRNDRRRDETVREARSRKYDDSDYYGERDYNRDDPREKYETWAEESKAYTKEKSYSSNRPGEARPPMGRRTSTNQVPRESYTMRSRASAKPSRGVREDRDYSDIERELKQQSARKARMQEDEQARNEDRDRLKREDAEREQYEQEKAEKAAAARRAERERADELDRREQQRERDRERERERDRLEREAPRRRKENVEPYERRPPQLQHNHSSPPFIPETALPRVRTEPVTSEPIQHPSLSRSSTMPSVPLSNTAARRATAGTSKLRDSYLPDSGYSSNSSSEQRPGRPTTTTKHYYTVNHEPASASSRRRSPEPATPKAERGTAKMMANLAKHAVRPSLQKDYHGSSYTTLPTRTRSPGRSSRRDRDYESSSRRPLYGERHGSGYGAGNVSWSKPITEEDIRYAGRGRDSYGYAGARFDRRSGGMVPPTPQ